MADAQHTLDLQLTAAARPRAIPVEPHARTLWGVAGELTETKDNRTIGELLEFGALTYDAAELLRPPPDRIVVREMRGGAALELVQAMTSGHGGCMSTVHATHPMRDSSRGVRYSTDRVANVPQAAASVRVMGLELPQSIDRAASARRDGT